MKYLPDITSLRFVPASLMILFHAPQCFGNRGMLYFNKFLVFHKDMEAVYMFFSLSGFLIISMLNY